MKKLIISVFLIIFLIFIIYKTNSDNLIDYMSIGDILEYDGKLNNIKTTYEKIDEMITNMDNLIKTVKKLSSSNIILIGYYNPYKKESKELNRLFSYIDDKYLTISKKYKITYVDIYKTIKDNSDYLPNFKDYHINSKGYLKVASQIIDKLKY